jgi:hypothetical protein
VAVTVDLLVEAMDEISETISKEWVGLIVLPAISSVAGKICTPFASSTLCLHISCRMYHGY